uniref:Uncharacterized protein n=1 Tax=Arundo donax TaxID=35708 RepID=A0A0A9CY37_ARUDO
MPRLLSQLPRWSCRLLVSRPLLAILSNTFSASTSAPAPPRAAAPAALSAAFAALRGRQLRQRDFVRHCRLLPRLVPRGPRRRAARRARRDLRGARGRGDGRARGAPAHGADRPRRAPPPPAEAPRRRRAAAPPPQVLRLVWAPPALPSHVRRLPRRVPPPRPCAPQLRGG